MDAESPFKIVLTGSITKNGEPFCDASLTYHNCEYADVVEVEKGLVAFHNAMIATGQARAAGQ